MQGAIVMLLALTGLGCQNKPVDSTDLPAVLTPAPATPSPEAPAAATTAIPSPETQAAATTASPSPETSAATTTATPPPYPRYFPETYPDIEELYSTHLGSLYATFYSFVFGHDPGIPSAREIEASVLGNEGSP